jgi:hypothetical protein
MTLLEESFHIVGHVLEINLHDIWLKMGFTLQWQKPPAGRVQSLGAAQSLENKKKIPSPRLLWGIRLVATVQTKQGVVDCGPAQATVCCHGCAAGFGGFLGRETKTP